MGNILEVVGVEKKYPGVVANRDVSLQVREGSIHAIIGENGAGKSTLMKTLYGLIRPDAGSIKVFGQEVSLKSPQDAIALGIGMVHQHFKLADNATVLENVILGSEPSRFGFVIKYEVSGMISKSFVSPKTWNTSRTDNLPNLAKSTYK